MSLHICISGFGTKTLNVTGLEEYWPYKFKVDAATVKGNKTSDFSIVFRTTQAGNSFYMYCHIFSLLRQCWEEFCYTLGVCFLTLWKFLKQVLYLNYYWNVLFSPTWAITYLVMYITIWKLNQWAMNFKCWTRLKLT